MKFKAKAEKLGVAYYDVDMGMFDFTVRFVVGDYGNSLELVQWYHEVLYYNTEPGQPPYGEMFYTAPYSPVVWLPRAPRGPAELGTLAHECCHAMMALCQWASIPVDSSTNEVFAHGVGFLVAEFKRRIVAERTENSKRP